MSDAFEKTFVVGVSVDRAWDAFADGEQRSKWEALTFEVLEIASGGCAEQAGMRTGDVLLTAGGAPVFTSRELWVMLRAQGPGGELDVEYARGRERLVGSGTLGVLRG